MKIIKFLTLVLLSFSIFVLFDQNVVYAEGYLYDIEGQAKGFIDKGSDEANASIGNIEDSIASNFVGIGQILTFIGAGVLIMVTTYLGIQYFISPPDKKGALKEKLIAILVATIVIFGAYNIWKIVLDIAQNLD